MTGGLAAPLVAAGAATIIGSAGAAALGSVAGIAVMTSLFGAAGAGLTGKQPESSGGLGGVFSQGGPALKDTPRFSPGDGGEACGFSHAGSSPTRTWQQASPRTGQ